MEAILDEYRRSVVGAPREHGEAADVVEGKTREPDIFCPDAEISGRGQRAPEKISVREHDRAGRAFRSRGETNRGGRIEPPLEERGLGRPGARSRPGPRGRLRGGGQREIHLRAPAEQHALRFLELPVDRHRQELRAMERVNRGREVQALLGSELDRDVLPGHEPLREERDRGRRNRLLEPGVRPRLLAHAQRGALGPGARPERDRIVGPRVAHSASTVNASRQKSSRGLTPNPGSSGTAIEPRVIAGEGAMSSRIASPVARPWAYAVSPSEAAK